MASAVNIGTLQGVLAMRAEYRAEMDKFEARLRAVEESTKRTTRTTKTETEKINDSYRKVAASLDPVIRNQQRYEQAEKSLNAALQKGLVTQAEHNRLLEEAKKKYLSAGESAEKYARRVQDVGGQLSTTGSNLIKFVSLPLAAIGGLSIKAATDFETSFAGVRKTIDATEEEFAELAQDLRDMAAGENPIPIDVNELNAVAESAGQLGIAREKVIDFTHTMADLGETTNLTATEAAESIAQFQNIFGEAGNEVDRFGSTLVALGNAGASTEKSILSMGVRIAGAGKQIGLTQGQVLAIASALSSVNIEAEAGGSAISKVMIEMALAVSKGGKELNNFAAVSRMSASEFKEAFKNDAAGTVTSFIEGLGRLKSEGGDMLLVLDQMGISEIRMRDALLRAAGAGDLLRQSLDLQGRAWAENTALTNEAKKRYETFDSQLKIVKNEVKDAAITFGTALLPALRDGLEIIKPWIDTAADLASKFANLDPFTQKVILGISGLATVAGPAVFVTGQLIQSWGQILLLAPKLTVALNANALAMAGVRLGMIGIIGVGIYAFLDGLIDKWKRASEAVIAYNLEVAKIEGSSLNFVKQVSQGMTSVSQEIFDVQLKNADKLAEKIQGIGKELDKMTMGGKLSEEDIRFSGIQPFEDYTKKKEELDSLWKTYGKLRTSLTEVNIEGKEAKKTFDPGPFEGLDLSSEKTSKAINDVAESIREMQRRAENARLAFISAGRGVKEHQAELLRQKVVGAILQEENKLRELGLKLTDRQVIAIRAAIAAEDEFNKKLQETLRLNESLLKVVLTATDNIAGKGFAADFERFTDEAHRGMELIQTDVEEMLSGLSKIKDLDLDIEFNSRLMDVEPHLREVEADYLSFLENLGSGFEQAGENAITAGERILTTIGTRFGKTADKIRAKLQFIADIDLASNFKAQLAIPDTPTEELEALKKTLDRLRTSVDSTGKALLSESEAREIYNRALIEGAKEFATSVISVVQTLGTLGGATGKWNKALSGLSGIVSSGGYNIAAWLELFIGLAEGFTDKGGVHAGAEIDVSAGRAAVSEAWTMVKGQLKEMYAAAEEFGDAIDLIVKELGGSLIDLPNIEILQKGEGWVVNIENMARRYFEDFQEAVAWGAAEAVKQADLSGVSEEIMTAFRSIIFDSLEEIRDFTSFANEYTGYGLSSLSTGLKDLTGWFVESARKAHEYGLSIAKVSEEFGRRAQSWRDQVLGIVRSPEEQVHQNVVDFNAWIEQQRLSAQIQIDAASAQMMAAQVQMNAAQAMLKGQGMDRDPEMIALFLDSQRLFKDAAARLDMWTKALENLPPAITPGEEEEAKKRARKGGGGGRGDQEGTKDWISDKRFELDTRGMDEYRRSVLEKEREYQERLDGLGKKEKGQRAEIIALRERELAIMAQERRDAISADYSSFVNQSNAFEEVRNTASRLIEDISNSPFGDPEKAAMIGNVMAEVQEQIEQLSLETASGLFGSLIQDLERFGAGEGMLLEARQQMALIEHTLKIAHYRAEFEILKANGSLSQEILKTLGKAIDFVSGVDPLKFIENSSEGTKSGQLYNKRREEMNQSVTSTISELERLREAFRSAKDKVLETVQDFDRGGFGAVAPEASWEAARSQFESTIASAKGGSLEALEGAPEAFKNALDVLKEFSPALYASEAFKLRDKLASLGDLSTIKQGNLVITDFERREQHKQTITTLQQGFSDLSSHASAQQDQLGMLIVKVSDNNQRQQEINIRLTRLESGNLARK